MGRAKRNKKKHLNRAKSNGQWTEERRVGFEKENARLFSYYKQQGIIPEGEWEEFDGALRRDLPVSFRIQGCLREARVLRETLEKRYFAPIAEATEDAAVFVPKQLPWYENAFQTPMSRSEVRSHPVLARLHNFLVTEAELGHISRQEAVSMLPPLLLAPQAHHTVLDVCAAPGSKTMQLIEMMHQSDPNPSTIRKNPDIWKSWSPQEGIGLHKLQISIASRSVQQLKGGIRERLEQVGGLMVYSTCSMNPLEDEAVVAALLRANPAELRLVDAKPLLPNLVAYRGVSEWKVIDRDMREYLSVNDIPPVGPLKRALVSSMWPPTQEEAELFHLNHALRIAPHQQNTGGFFVALIERVQEKGETGEVRLSTKAPNYKQKKMFKDEPFTFLKKDDERWQEIKEYYGIAENFPYENLFNRMRENENSRQLFFVNDRAKQFIEKNMHRLSIQNAGMKMFGRNENKVDCVRFRISQEGVAKLIPYLSKQKVQISREDMLLLLNEEAKGPEKKTMLDMEKLEAKDKIRAQKTGSVVLYVEEDHPVCAWVGQFTAAPYVGKEEKIHLLRLLGQDTETMEDVMKTKRKEKAMRDREEARKEREMKSNDGEGEGMRDRLSHIEKEQEAKDSSPVEKKMRLREV